MTVQKFHAAYGDEPYLNNCLPPSIKFHGGTFLLTNERCFISSLWPMSLAGGVAPRASWASISCKVKLVCSLAEMVFGTTLIFFTVTSPLL
ncbi:unnamed protein product [Mesocestoides corti]|uniref:GRAM domain-containing protein n=1 Tax=Mesocestoides corti TaxID=53468 RepID=A0A0R3U569_MESCO|nr:unnamed protein product [Mesocestoides corti]